jgi:uncharacterized protein (TIGR02246 family)
MPVRVVLRMWVVAAALVAASVTAPAHASYADDRAEIENLMARYLFALDFRDAPAYAATFTEDGVLDFASGVLTGRKAIGEFVNTLGNNASQAVREASALMARSRHNVTNIAIDVNGDHAKARAYWTSVRVGDGGKGVQVISYGHYEDELVRQNGKWLFSKRKVYNELLENRRAAATNPIN